LLERNWKLLGSRPVSDHRIFRIRYDNYRMESSGLEHEFVVLEAPDWVHVVPITTDGQVVLVRQYRHGTQRVSLEAPGGVMDEGETPEQAALRELREETGYQAGRLVRLPSISPNPAMMNNTCHIFLAEDCVPAGDLELDALEHIEVELHRPEDIAELVRQGQIDHGLVVASLGMVGLSRQRT